MITAGAEVGALAAMVVCNETEAESLIRRWLDSAARSSCLLRYIYINLLGGSKPASSHNLHKSTTTLFKIYSDDACIPHKFVLHGVGVAASSAGM